MAHSGVHKDRGELRIHENLDELGTDLAEYIAELSEASVKERGVFAIAISGGSLIGLMGYLCNFISCFLIFWFYDVCVFV
jgi:6-phosphogluconolactonase